MSVSPPRRALVVPEPLRGWTDILRLQSYPKCILTARPQTDLRVYECTPSPQSTSGSRAPEGMDRYSEAVGILQMHPYETPPNGFDCL